MTLQSNTALLKLTGELVIWQPTNGITNIPEQIRVRFSPVDDEWNVDAWCLDGVQVGDLIVRNETNRERQYEVVHTSFHTEPPKATWSLHDDDLVKILRLKQTMVVNKEQ